jgi:hypothetical protein
MVMPPGLLPRLEKPIKDIISQLYEDVTTDSEDCEIPLVGLSPAGPFPFSRLNNKRYHTCDRYTKVAAACRCRKYYGRHPVLFEFAHEGDGLVDFWRRLRSWWHCYVRHVSIKPVRT